MMSLAYIFLYGAKMPLHLYRQLESVFREASGEKHFISGNFYFSLT